MTKYQDNAMPKIPMFSLEDFMKSIMYAPESMPLALAREEIEAKKSYTSAAQREAMILRRAMELLPIGIRERDLIAGNYGREFADPEYIEKADRANERDMADSQEYKVRSEQERIISGRYLLFGIYTPSHTCIEYDKIVHQGLKAYEARIQESIGHLDTYGRSYCEAMKMSIGTVRMFAGRYAALAREMGEREEEPVRRKQLSRMAEALERVPYEPAADFYQALQSMWIMHTLLPASERSWASVSIGRMDQFLLKDYREWLASGHSREEAKELLKSFFLLLDSYGDGSGTLNLGSDWNELSQLLLEVEKEVRYRAPIVAVRVGEHTGDELYDAFIDRSLFEIGQPTFYSEENCLKALQWRGMSPKEDFAVNSCMGNVVVGDELADMWGCCVNMGLPLELAVNMGRPLHGELPESLERYLQIEPEKPVSMEVIKRKYAQYLQGIVRYVTDQNQKRAAWTALNRPNPLLSMLLNDCIAHGRDRAHGAVHAQGEAVYGMISETERGAFGLEEIHAGRGAKYHNATVLAMGDAHAGDALAAIEKLVFEDKEYTLEEIMEAAQHNYTGNPQYRRIMAALRKCPKYAQGMALADSYVSFVLDALADSCEACYTGNLRYLPTCHTIDANIQFGSCVYASLDGRMDGEAFAKNADAALWAIKSDPAELMLSASSLPQERFSGGVPIDLYVPQEIFERQELRDKIRSLLKAYFRNGGMQVQVNSVNLKLLKKAYDDPENYPHVIVRKGGFSIYFTDMLRCVQKDMIERFEKEQGQ